MVKKKIKFTVLYISVKSIYFVPEFSIFSACYFSNDTLILSDLSIPQDFTRVSHFTGDCLL